MSHMLVLSHPTEFTNMYSMTKKSIMHSNVVEQLNKGTIFPLKNYNIPCPPNAKLIGAITVARD